MDNPTMAVAIDDLYLLFLPGVPVFIVFGGDGWGNGNADREGATEQETAY